jgi:hypothetical protein
VGLLAESPTGAAVASALSPSLSRNQAWSRLAVN